MAEPRRPSRPTAGDIETDRLLRRSRVGPIMTVLTRPEVRPTSSVTKASARAVVSMWLPAAAVSVLWSIAGLARQQTMRTSIDLGLYTQAVKSYSHGQWPWSSLKAQGGFNLLGDHFTPIVAVLGPFYRIWPHVELLIVAQAILIGLTVAIVERTAIRVLGDAGAGIAVAAAFGVSWGIAGMALFDFHEIAFALPLLAMALDRAVADQWRTAVSWSLPLMLVKEDSAFLIAGLAIACWIAGHRRLAVASMSFAIVAFGTVVVVVIPRLSYYGAYTYWSVAGQHHGLLAAPASLIVNLWHAVVSGQPPLTVFLALACVAFMPLRSPLILVAVPSLLSRFISTQPHYWGSQYQYNATLMVIVFLAALDGWRRQGPPLGGRVTPRAAGAVLVLIALVIGCATSLRSVDSPTTYRCNRCATADAMLARIPDGAVVLADTYLVDQIVDRDTVELLAQNLLDSTGHTYRAEWIALDVDDHDTFPTPSAAYRLGSYTAQEAGYVPVWASTTGYILLHYNPAAANAFNEKYGMVACASSPNKAALCSTPPEDDSPAIR